MKTVKPIYVLDACALLRLAQDEPGAERVAEILSTAQNGAARVLLHQINLGEVVCRIAKVFGYAVAERKHAEIQLLPIETVAFSDDIFWVAEHQTKIPIRHVLRRLLRGSFSNARTSGFVD